MARFEHRCSKCGGTAQTVVGDRCLYGELRWGGRTECAACGSVTEFDGFGEVPDDYKKAIVEQDGEWHLSIESEHNRVAALKVIRELIDVPLAEAKEKLNNIRGTKGWVEWLAWALRAAGIECTSHLSCR